MAIKLSWVNRNTQQVTTTIYRSDSKMDRAALPAPLVVLSAGETEYIDTTAVQGNLYYYIFKTSNGVDSIISRNQPIQAAETRGPGSNVFIYGNRELGLYDVISIDSFITATNLVALVGYAGTAYANVNWYKCARRGKVYMVPDRCIGYGVSYNALVAKNLVDGLVVSIAGYNWKVRLMRGWNESDSSVPLPSKALGTAVDMQTYTQTCEFNDFIYPLCLPTPTGQRLPNWTQTAVASLYPSGTQGTNVLCAEKSIEGDTTVARVFTAITTSERTKIAGASMANAPATTSSILGWWPVLELVES